MMFSLVKEKEGEFLAINRQLESEIPKLLDRAPEYEDLQLEARMDRFKELASMFILEIPDYESKVLSWSRAESVSLGDAFTCFRKRMGHQ